MFACTYQTPVGEITLAEENGALKRLSFGHLPKLPAGTEVKETPLILKACRAVGMANNKNPLAIVIPCHRVVGSDGKLVGYGGGLGIKEYLLNLELKAGA